MTRPIPYPSDTKAKGWRFELDLEQVMQSDTWALAAPDMRPWLLMMWTVAWQQTPCGSMPSEDTLIVARLGCTAKVYEKMKAVLLRGWWLAEDGRIYHDTITQRVLDMLTRKDAERNRKAEYRARKEAERKAAADIQKTGADVQSRPKVSHGTDAGRTRESGGSDATGTGTGTGLISKEEKLSHTPSVHPENLSHGTDAGHDDAPDFKPSPYGQICLAMKAIGIADTSPGNPEFRALVDAGADVEEFMSAAKDSVKKRKGFRYAVGIVASARQQAAELAQQIHRGAMPAAPAPESFRERGERAARDQIAAVLPGIAAKPRAQRNGDVIDVTPTFQRIAQ